MKKTNLKAVSQNKTKKTTDRSSKKTVKPAKPLSKNEKMIWGKKTSGEVDVVKVYKKLPKGWRFLEGANNPKGYQWASNNKSLFSGEYKHALVETDWHQKMPTADKNELHGSHPITIINKSGKQITFGKVKKTGK